MKMEVSFNIEEMNQIWEEALEYYHTYKESRESLKRIMDEISIVWKSGETETYEEFQKLFSTKYPKLIETENKMKELVDRLEQKKNDYQAATEKSIQSFE